MGGWMDGWTGGMAGSSDGEMDGRRDGRREGGCSDGWLQEHKEGWVQGLMEGGNEGVVDAGMEVGSGIKVWDGGDGGGWWGVVGDGGMFRWMGGVANSRKTLSEESGVAWNS